MIILLISIISVIVIPRFYNVVEDAKQEACQTNIANINALVQLYYIKEGKWPQADLDDLIGNTNYFPDTATPTCPVTPTALYEIYPTGHRVTGHVRGVKPHLTGP